MWGDLLRGVLGFFSDIITDWWSAMKAKEDAWGRATLEGQMESMREGKAVEAEIIEAGKNAVAPTSPEEFNKLFGALSLFAVCVLMGGCFNFRVYVDAYRPVPPAPEAITIDTEEPFNSREQTLVEAYTKLRAQYVAFREDAIASNTESGYPIPAGDDP